MRAEASRAHAPFWRKTSWELIPNDGWVDVWHLNGRGARAFSRWLGDRVGISVRSGRWK